MIMRCCSIQIHRPIILSFHREKEGKKKERKKIHFLLRSTRSTITWMQLKILIKWLEKSIYPFRFDSNAWLVDVIS